MIEEPDENDKCRAKADYLHFEHEDPSMWDIHFDTFDEAVDFVNNSRLSFVTEDWEPFGMFEKRIECKNPRGDVVGQLLMLMIKLWDE
jgi:hypothetical protein